MLYDFRNISLWPFNESDAKSFFSQFQYDHLNDRFVYSNSLRNQLLAVMNEQDRSKCHRPEVILPILEKYVAVLNSICEELKPKKDVIVPQTKKNVLVKWSSILHTKPGQFCRSFNFFHEQAQAYLLLAIQHYNSAGNLYKNLDMSQGVLVTMVPDLQKIMNELRKAAGLLKYAADSLFPFSLTTKTPDQSSDVFRGLSKMCVGLAQEFLIIIAVTQKKGTLLVAKLAAGTAQTFEEILPLWEKILGAQSFNQIDPALRFWLKERGNLYKAISLKYMGKWSAEDDQAEYGHAVRYMMGAQDVLRKSMLNFKNKAYKVQCSHNSVKVLIGSYQNQLNSIDKLLNVARDENDTIYHALVPNSLDLLPEAEVKIITKGTPPTDYPLPPDMPVRQASDEWNDFLGKWKDEDGNMIRITRAGGFHYEGKNQFRQGRLTENREVVVTYADTDYTGVLVNGNWIEWSNQRRWVRVEG